MTQRKVTRFTCDAKGCTDFLDVPSLKTGEAISQAAEQGWTVNQAGEDEPGDFTYYCPVHKSHSGWDWQADYPTSESGEEEALTEDPTP